MVFLCILETSLYLFFSAFTDYIQVQLMDFFGILGCVLVVEVIKHLFGIYFENITQVQENTAIAERDEEKCERIGVPIVNSLMIYKMCQALDLKVQLAAEPDRKTWIAKRKSQDTPRHPVPKVYSKTVLKLCEAVGIDAELSHSTESERLQKNQLKRSKPLPVVQSVMIFKICQALELDVELHTDVRSN
ncbi:hypothetical protein TNIN_117711 [Trichonephila inaurata madagascariensis]|uniref:Uncharacterized protein n=1 Tax=Trichonephila inaurata madagascariensis TaxID=2747483 RepID=A0A8X7BQS3_9ARAC|nr:hypothetical protein TNIN_117711 [Trichonephila inaurata madagascariensis]